MIYRSFSNFFILFKFMRFHSDFSRLFLSVLILSVLVVLPGQVSAEILSIEDISLQASKIFEAAKDLQNQVESLVSSAVLNQPVSEIGECGSLDTVSGVQNCEQFLKSKVIDTDEPDDVVINNMANVLVAVSSVLGKIIQMGSIK